MKTKLFAVLTFALIFNQLQATERPATANCDCQLPSDEPAFALRAVDEPAFALRASAGKGGDPLDIKIVVSQKRIYLVTDEMPMKCLKIKVANAEGKIVLEQCFSSKCAEWFLNIEALPKGEYTLHLGTDRVEKFKK